MVVAVVCVSSVAVQRCSISTPPADGTLHLIGDATIKGKRGQKHPPRRKARVNEYARFCYRFELVLLTASWAHYRLPVALSVIDSRRKGRQNILFRRMLREFVPRACSGSSSDLLLVSFRNISIVLSSNGESNSIDTGLQLDVQFLPVTFEYLKAACA